jgi:hypothetical protein
LDNAGSSVGLLRSIRKFGSSAAYGYFFELKNLGGPDACGLKSADAVFII